MLFTSSALGAALLPLMWLSNAAAAPRLSTRSSAPTPPCRFSLQYTQEEILKDPSQFASDLLYWEGQFHQNNVSYNSVNGMSYDGTLIDPTTGEATAKHDFSASSKEVSFDSNASKSHGRCLITVSFSRRFKSWCMPKPLPAHNKLHNSFRHQTPVLRQRWLSIS